MAQLAAKRELAKLAARPTPKRHAKRKDLDAHGFPMSLEQRALDARTEALEAYDAAARSATRREAALDAMLNALPGLSEVVIESTDASIEELKRRLDERGVDYRGASTRPTSLHCYNERSSRTRSAYSKSSSKRGN